MDSLEKIFEENAHIVYRFLFSLTHDRDLAEELTQETFYQAVKNVDQFDYSCRVSTWLCAIAKNQLQNFRRKEKKHSILISKLGDDDSSSYYISEPDSIESSSAEDQILSKWNRVEILRLMHQLSEPGREVLYLRIFGCLSFRDIGEIMGKSENWARVIYYRGKQKLREVINNEQKE